MPQELALEGIFRRSGVQDAESILQTPRGRCVFCVRCIGKALAFPTPSLSSAVQASLRASDFLGVQDAESILQTPRGRCVLVF